MTLIKIKNLSSELSGHLKVVYCDSFLCKLRGLAWRRSLGKEDGILLVQDKESIVGSAIHMLGMNFDLAIIWLDKDKRVVDTGKGKRWRSVLKARRPAQFVIECGVSRLKEFSIGDQIAFENV
jgi:uncharacterized membrane protein (UPF0127 family)